MPIASPLSVMGNKRNAPMKNMQWLAWSLACSTALCPVTRAQSGSSAKAAPTPPMGWNSWNKFGHQIDDAVIRAQADAMVTSGMKAAGYQYVNIDEGWEGTRDADGNIHPTAGFPDMKALAAYVHAKGLKIGIYSSPGPKACGGYEGSYGHEEQDAKLFASWDMDYLKYDWCTAGTVYTRDQYPAALRKMGDALAHAGRPMVYSIHGRGAVWEYSKAQGANLWRTTGDINDTYARMLAIGFGQEGLERFAGPGHWNDPDMLEIGNGGMKDIEYRMHMSLWCLLAAPLIAGNDLTKMTPETVAILTNPELIAVDQDPAGIQGHRLLEQGAIVVMMKPMADGSKVVGFFNREQGVVSETVKFADIGLGETASVRDLWAKKDLGVQHGSFSTDVPEHGVVVVRIH
jgi:alpha-galactosidase